MVESSSIHTDTRLYAFGSNGAGQLGVGHYNDLNEPQACQFLSDNVVEESDSQPSPMKTQVAGSVKSLVAGGNHTLLLTEGGSLFASGNNEDGRCALPLRCSTLSAFTKVSWARSRNITHVAATWETSFFVQDAHTVWVSGSGTKGELGLGQDGLLASSPQVALNIQEQEEDPCEIVSLTGSMSHVVVLLSNGHVYGWGSSRKGQLGEDLKHQKVVWRPQRLRILDPIDNIAVGRDFTALLSPNRNLMLLGNLKSENEYPQSELAYSSLAFLAGWSTLYTLSDGHVQGYGQGRRGQLPPPNMPLIERLSVGSEHCIALTASRKVITWGWAEHGNCGLPLDDRNCVAGRFNSISVPDDDVDCISGVAAGCASSFVWTVKRRGRSQDP